MKKYLNLTLACILFTVIFCSCHHNDAGDMYQGFPIQSELEMESKVIDWETLTSEERQEYKSISCVINSQDEFPEENLMGLEKLKSMNINFDKYTLLLCYNRIPGIIEGHKYVWRKNIMEGVFELFMDFHVRIVNNSDGDGEDSDILTYYCTALLVNKIPANSEVIFYRSTSFSR